MGPTEKKRTKFEIIVDILTACINGADREEIAIRSNLSYEILMEYIRFLVDFKMLNPENQGKEVYFTSEKGINLLSRFAEIRFILCA